MQYTHRGRYASRQQLLSIEERIHTPMWQSYFAFDDRVVPYLSYHRAMNGRYPHDVYIPEIVLDIDSGDLDRAAEQTRRAVDYLVRFHNLPEQQVLCYFSGKKGFHLHLPNVYGIQPSSAAPFELKATLEKDFSFVEGLDLKPVNVAGMIRVPNTLHSEGRYKVRITLSELFDLERDSFIEISEERFERHVDLSVHEPTLFRFKRRPDWSPKQKARQAKHDPTRHVTCMQKLFARGPVEGRRHDDLLRLASWLWRSGIPRESAVAMLEGYDGRDTIRTIKDVYQGLYPYSCHDEIMAEFCDPQCVFYKQKSYGATMIKSSLELTRSLADYGRKLRDKQGINLRDHFPTIGRDYWILPQEMVIVTGDTGMGKSAMAQTLVVDAKKPTLYFNLENAEALMWRRFLQIAHGWTKHETMLKVGALNGQSEAWEKVHSPLEHIQMLSVAPTADAIEEMLKKHKPQIVVVDTTDVIEVPQAGNNDMFQLKYIIETMRRLAHAYSIIVICVHHINKDGSRATTGEFGPPRKPTMNDLTGNRTNVTRMDHVFCMWGDRNNKMREFFSLKSRDEDPISIQMVFDTDTMRMKPMQKDETIPLFE